MNALKQFFSQNMLNKLIIINIAIYLLINITEVISFLLARQGIVEQFVYQWVALPAYLPSLILKPWTAITYMFTHESFWHLLGNMLWLYFLGQMFFSFFNGKQMFALYILGGFAGAALYIISYNIFPVFRPALLLSTCIGASAAVTAIVIALCVYKPDFKVLLFGIIPISLKWLGIFYIAFDVMSIMSDNAGGHISHIGGAIIGLLFAVEIKKGKDITNGFNKIMDKIVAFFQQLGGSKKMKVSYRRSQEAKKKKEHYVSTTDADYSNNDAARQAKIDQILDKISKSGYDSLTKEEKEFMFRQKG